ncbi:MULTISPECIES: tetratricopeptide repeat protein [unclassified Streptomyces]|uniref:tetratricopeptide repeat protein n=1 Tax=unclassified Streptomyces TaxID=2593676 RepID=UPI00190E54E6|nr:MULTISPECIES: tetratricopeptide repeat protein [unclassified Streptomyces]MBK3569647.1 sel1 repeat family protein [Streptomyces sp. MBT62]MBK6016280.1 sel1 repeat family protein [Streptomyces sp. MBT53]
MSDAPVPSASESAAESVERGRRAAAEGDWKTAVMAWVAGSNAGSLESANLVVTAVPPLKAQADAGDVDAMALLAGVMLDFFRESALPMVLTYATAAARAGHPSAQRTLGLMYRTGRGVEPDDRRAEDLFTAAAKAGDPFAAFNLAGMHITGDVVARDHDECLRLLRRAVAGGVTEAAAVLGDRLASVDEDAEALSWYVYAAERGHAGSMFAAGCRYRDGLGTVPDPVQAVRWFLAMLDKGDGDGLHEAIQLVRRGVTDEQIRTAGRLSGRPSEAETLIRTARPHGSR